MLIQQLKHALTKLRTGARQGAGRFMLARLYAAGLALHRASLGAFLALSEDDPARVYMESGPSFFCSCCGERWHAFTHAECPNGCPWVYTSFRAPAWAEDDELIEKVRSLHRANAVRARSKDADASTSLDDHDAGRGHWPTADGKIPRA